MSITSLKQRGDTIVEVLLATVILSVVLAGAFTLSNRATRINQQAFERTQVTNLMQRQAELVRAARDSYLPSRPSDPFSVMWEEISTTYAQASGGISTLTECDDLTTLAASGRLSDAFHIVEDNSVAETNLRVDSGIVPGQGLYNIWTEIERGSGGDFWNVHVYGCWEAVGSSPTNVSSIVLRLEDPI